MEALRIYKINNRNSDLLSVSRLHVFRIHNRCVQPKKTTRATEDGKKIEKQNANASAKSKELPPYAQSQPYAAHLLLPQRTEKN